MRSRAAQKCIQLVVFQQFLGLSPTHSTTISMMSSKVAVVTGGNKGIGLAIVRALCERFRGDIYLTARDEGRGREAVASLSAEGLKVDFHRLDVTDVGSIAVAADFFKRKYGGVDVLVNNAGIAFKVADTTPFATQADVTLRTNYFGTRDVLTHFLPLVKAGGRVVNVSSFVSVRSLNKCGARLRERFRSDDIGEDELTALMERFVELAGKGEHEREGWPQTAYGVSKIGVTTLSMIHARRLSKERPDDQILVNACCPGWVRTDMAGPQAPKSPEDGAVTPVFLALLPAGASEPHGKFVSDETVQTW
ncbi:carbonyl reductase [NADPH] 1 isoform X2 [Phyllopteryx taeniolatus]|uniref:carbonyl reductase [NADPH] 1 isoform X2 n=1 Tax=Phyllopteryx taeniolatus TaxID=161469 RepID=UPI002AD4221C|nr:carbonyl reductase [NADPH] 1 isoform X2 [Phyllopteryx taeniolatus]